jgi:hypothetical protein
MKRENKGKKRGNDSFGDFLDGLIKEGKRLLSELRTVACYEDLARLKADIDVLNQTAAASSRKLKAAIQAFEEFAH